ncbi:MAG TPA: hypothetical protein PKX92_00160 [Edaphocola sp.]|nr:hypothetical protein [Edaphocola sp.]
MLWTEIKGLEKSKSDLIKFYRSARMPHAILVLGKEGFGGLPLAVGFAQFLLCENKIGDTLPCGVCNACIKTKKFVHPDLYFNFPSFPPKSPLKANSKYFIKEFREFLQENPFGNLSDWLQKIGAADKQAGNISAEETREMVDRLSLKAAEGLYKIQIIWRPEFLGREGNILLKSLEEPPPNTIFILVAEELDTILETILSRTQLVNIPPISPDEMSQILMDVYKINPENTRQAVLLSEGSMTNALAVTADTDLDYLEFLKEWFNGVFTFNGNIIGKWIEQAAKLPTKQLREFLAYTQKLLTYSVKVAMIPSYQPLLANEDLQFVQKLAKQKFSIQALQEMDGLINDAIYNIGRNANVKVVLLHLSVALQYALKGQKLSV